MTTDASPAAGPLTLRSNFLWALSGNLIFGVANWGVLVVLAQLTSPGVVGQFSLGVAIGGPVFTVANLALRVVLVTHSGGDYRYGDYFGLRLLTTVLALCAIAAIALIAGFRAATVAMVLIIGLAKGFEAITDLCHGVLQRAERMDRVAQALMIKGPLALLALSAALLWTGSGIAGVAGLALGWGVTMLLWDAPRARRVAQQAAQSEAAGVGRGWLLPFRPRFDRQVLARLAWLAAPLGVATMIITVTNNVPRYFLVHLRGETDLGLFSAIAYLQLAGLTIVDALGQSISPRLAKHHAAGDRRAFARVLFKSLGIAGALGLCGLAFALLVGGPFLELFFGAQYAAHLSVFHWVMVAAVARYLASVIGYSLPAAQYYRAPLFIYGLALAVCGGSCAILIPRLGILGASWALVVEGTVQLGLAFAVILHALSSMPVRDPGRGE